MNASRTKSLLTKTGKCSNHEFLLEQLTNYQGVRNLTQKLSRGHVIWKDTRKSALTYFVNWQTEKSGAVAQSLKSLLG